jgi:hypothetical protein
MLVVSGLWLGGAGVVGLPSATLLLAVGAVSEQGHVDATLQRAEKLFRTLNAVLVDISQNMSATCRV